MSVSILDIDADCYSCNELHRPDRNWVESNCYTDLWIEILHALGLQPIACLGFTLASDYEGDQWTFFKPPLGDLSRLYGLRTQEMILWRELAAHCETQIGEGRLPLIEVDAFYLPDTQQTDYRRNHAKTTIAINSIDRCSKFLGYFHNTGYFTLEGSDYDGIFRLDRETPDDHLPPYCEIVKLGSRVDRAAAELRDLARQLGRGYLARRPEENPVTRFAKTFEQDIAGLVGREEALFHAWVFATLRQLGSGYELTAAYLRWLANGGDQHLASAAEHFATISDLAKMLIMKAARMVASGRQTDVSTQFTQMADAWDAAFLCVERGL